MKFRLSSPGVIIEGNDLEDVYRKLADHFRHLADGEAAAKKGKTAKNGGEPNPFEQGSISIVPSE